MSPLTPVYLVIVPPFVVVSLERVVPIFILIRSACFFAPSDPGGDSSIFGNDILSVCHLTCFCKNITLSYFR